MNLKTRITKLEAATEPSTSPANRRWHRVTVDDGCSVEAAIDHYGRDRIGTGDGLIHRTLYS